jgi:hypothetical protein
MTSFNAFDRLQIASTGFQEASILIAAAELDLGTQILERSNSATATDLSAACKLDCRALTVLSLRCQKKLWFVKPVTH